MLEDEEAIISNLEEIDSTFSKINRILKEIKRKTDILKATNKNSLQDYSPLFRFFNIPNTSKTETQNHSEEINSSELVNEFEHSLQLDNSFSIVQNMEIVNPFIEFSGLLAHEKLSVNFERRYSEQGGQESYDFDSDESSLVDFDIEKLPISFQSEKLIENLYIYIKKNGGAVLQDIITHFGKNMTDKIQIFLELLIRKKFLKQKNGVFLAGNK